jgi:colicin import membrane protein
MSRAFNNIVIYNGYPLSVAVAVGVHITLLVSLLYLQVDNNAETIEFVQPTVIKSLFIDENPQITNQKSAERRRLERIEQQRAERLQAEDARKEREADAAAQLRAQEQEAAKAEADARELARQQAVLRDREEVERLLEQQQRREREQEQQRQRENAAAQQQRQEEAREREQQDREAQRASEASANAARTEFELIQSATGLIQQVVQENWSRPPSARNGMRTILQISMFPTGEVTDVTITQSSNDPAFDRAAETAVFRAAPFSELQSLPIKIFNDNFRSFSLTFQPEDLLN